MGGRGGGKSVSVAKWVISRLLQNTKSRGILIRDEAVQIKNSILNDVKNIANEVDLKSGGLFSSYFAIQDHGIKNLMTKEDAAFTIGMRNSNTAQTARLKSISRIDFNLAV